MTHLERNPTAEPFDAAADPDAFLIDDESDDFLDRHVFAIREYLADFRNA